MSSLTPPSRPPRAIAGVYGAPPVHWVGDGFRVHGFFAAIPDAQRRLDPFLMLDYHAPHVYPPSPRARGVGVHPHRGFETVSIAWEGAIAHHDSAGNGGVIEPGGVQWMTAGAGILHKEYHAPSFSASGGTFHMAQLWVNLPRAQKRAPPAYQGLDDAAIPVVPLPDGTGHVRVIAGSFGGVEGAARTHSPVNLLDVVVAAGGRAELAFPDTHNTAIVVLKGRVRMNGAVVAPNHLVLFAVGGGAIEVDAVEDAHLLVMDGAPLGEPIVSHGPFVMNTVAEIHEAIRDYQAGRFGTLT
jgi:redox-sensitive bicupin YhaK (pirin superfamily)